jgi:uncharacterized protein YraI
MFGKKFNIVIVICGLLLALSVPAMAQDVTPTPGAGEPTPAATPQLVLTATTDLFVTSPFRVNVRSGPGTEYTIIGKLTPAESLDITGQNGDNDWLRVNFNGQEGWVFLNVVDVNGAIESAPVVEAGPTAVLRDSPVPADTSASGDVVVLTRFNTNLRSTFSTDAEVVDVIPFNTPLVPQGRTENGNWLMVTFGEQSGWVFAPILFFSSGEAETLPVLGTSAETTILAQTTVEPITSP